MDLASILLTAASSAAFGLILGGATFFALRSRIEAAIYDGIAGFVADKWAELEENPEILEKAAKVMVPKLIKALNLPVDGQGEMKDLRIGGFKIPGPLAAMIFQRLLGGAANGAQNAAETAIGSVLG